MFVIEHDNGKRGQKSRLGPEKGFFCAYFLFMQFA